MTIIWRNPNPPVFYWHKLRKLPDILADIGTYYTVDGERWIVRRRINL